MKFVKRILVFSCYVTLNLYDILFVAMTSLHMFHAKPWRIHVNFMHEHVELCQILAAAEVTDEMDSKEGSKIIIEKIDLDKNLYRFGHTKLFFKAGVLGNLEELRDEQVGKIMTSFQSYIRGNAMRKKFKKMLDQRFVKVSIIILKKQLE